MTSPRSYRADQREILVPSIHCPSCVSHIETLLTSPLSPLSALLDPSSVKVSLLHKSVSYAPAATFLGPSSAATKPRSVDRRVREALREAGFALEGEAEAEGQGGKGGGVGGWGWWVTKKLDQERWERHLKNCEACAEAVERGEPAEGKAGEGAETPASVDTAGWSSPTPRASGLVHTKLQIEGMTCSSCTSTVHSVLSSLPSVDPSSVRINLLAASAELVHSPTDLPPDRAAAEVEEAGYGASVVESTPVGNEGEGEAGEGEVETRLEVEGMTCSSCTQSVTTTLLSLPGVSAASVDLLSASARVTHDPAQTSSAHLAEQVDESGYGARVVESRPKKGGKEKKKEEKEEEVRERTVEVRVEGMFCGECIKQIRQTLCAHPSYRLTSPSNFTLSHPTLTLTYLSSPHSSPPTTLRSLLSHLSLSHPDFAFHPLPPPSPSARAHALHAAEAKAWTWRFVVALVLAVPALAVGVGAGMVAPPESSWRQYWEGTLWGGASRGMVLMWAVATPVQFGVGSVFYIRTFRSARYALRSALRSSSSSSAGRTRPAWRWRALLTWGSMDTLVALGTSVAYAASLGMLVAAVRRGASHGGGGGDGMMGYFEMSVFLVLFIVLGRLLESWSKTKTGDAIAMLGALKPETGLLVELDSPFSPAVTPTIKPESFPAAAPSGSSPSSSSTVRPTSPSPNPDFSKLRTTPTPLLLLEVGDLLLLPAGALPPADAIIVHGSTNFDESSLTGESRPVKKEIGDAVSTGTTNLGAPVVVRVTAAGSETTIDRIVRVVAEAQGRKSPIEKLADRITGVFVPTIVLISLVTTLVWFAVALSVDELEGKTATGDKLFVALQFGIAALVIACPCGIGLAAPTAQAVGSGLAASHGILAHGGGEAFQTATAVDAVVFDKTGTLTSGEVEVTDAEVLPPARSSELEDVVWDAVDRLEERSTHPLAQAVRAYIRARETESKHLARREMAVLDAEEVAGRGVKGTFELPASENGGGAPGRFELFVGNERFMREEGADPAAHASTLDGWKHAAKSVVLVGLRPLAPHPLLPAADEAPQLVLLLALADAPRPETLRTVRALRAGGREVWMLSGDNALTAKAVAREVGIDEESVVAGVLPEEKAGWITTLQEEGVKERRRWRWGRREWRRKCVLFVGDGLNDAAAIASADVGVAMGSGSQITLSTADFVLLCSSPLTILTLLALSTSVKRRIAYNFLWALAFNCIGIPLAAGVFHPLGWTLKPVWSAAAMALSSVSVVASSLALRLWREPREVREWKEGVRLD